jgi:predicted nucleic acid-binding Zn ribbon protein
MESAKTVLGKALRRMNDPRATRTWLTASWTTLAGGPVAAHTRPTAIRNGICRIEADSHQWKQQMETMKEAIRERINSVWGGPLVLGIQIETAMRGRRIPYAEDNNHTPFIRRKHGRETS